MTVLPFVEHLVHVHLNGRNFRRLDKIDIRLVDEVRCVWIASEDQVVALAAVSRVPGDELTPGKAVLAIGIDRVIRISRGGSACLVVVDPFPGDAGFQCL